MTTPGVHALEVPPTAPPQRVDRWVAEATGLSRSHVQKLISAGNLTADGVALKANAVVGVKAVLPARVVVPFVMTSGCWVAAAFSTFTVSVSGYVSASKPDGK